MNRLTFSLALVLSLSLFPALAEGQNLVSNPGFENGQVGWTTFGTGWRASGGSDARSGRIGMVNDVLPAQNSTENWRGIYQNLHAISGQVYTASVWIRTVNIKRSESFLEVQFLDSDNHVLRQFDSPHITAKQDFTNESLANLHAPDGTTKISIRGIVHMPYPPDQSEFQIFDDFSLFRVN